MRRRPSRDPSRALFRLRRRADVRALAAAAARSGIDAWIVGGAVRDAFLGLPVPDVDAAVSRDAEGLARTLEGAGAGRAVFLSRDRPGPRVYRVAGRRTLDIAEIEGGSMLSDLARRDFTVNAVALPIAGGAALDPFGGLSDLARRRLTPVRAENLRDDPLRALRAARFLATHGLVPTRETLAAARAAASRFPAVAAERIGAELARILGAPRAGPAAAWAARAGILSAALGVAAGAGSRAVRALSRFEDAATRRLDEPRRRHIRLAALALAFGLDGREARAWLARLRLPRIDTDAAARLAELARGTPARRVQRREDWRWILDAGPLAPDALHLLARLGPRARTRAGSLARLSRRRPRRLAMTGEDVMHWLGIAAGPQVGFWLEEIAVAAAAGEVKSRREARDWLSVQVRERPRAAIIGVH
jgi:hypothetical protein